MLSMSMLMFVVLTSMMEKSNECKKWLKRVCLMSLMNVLLMNLSMNSTEMLMLGHSMYNSLLYMDSMNNYMMELMLLVGMMYMLLLSCNMTTMKVLDHMMQVKESLGLLMLFNMLGLVLLMLVNDLMMLFMVMELQSYSLYLMTSSYNSSSNSVKSGLYYFMVGSMGSFMMLDGTVSMYEEMGLTNMELMSLCMNNMNMYDMLMMLFGLFMKVGLAPFYSYSMVIYTLAPTMVTYYMSLTPKLSMLTMMLSLMSMMNLMNTDSSSNIINIISFIILLSMMIGSMGGMNVMKIKTLLAYSSLLNVSYMLLAIISNNGYSYIGYLFYILQYSITHINTFSIILLLPIYSHINLLNNNNNNNNNNNSNNNNNNNYDVMLSKYSPMEYISQFKVLLNKNSYLCMALCMSFFSLMGMPPTSGFYGKLLMLMSALGNGYMFLSMLLVISSSMSAYYYGSVMKELCFDMLNNYNVFNYKDMSMYNKSLLSKMESMYMTLKDNMMSKNGNNMLLMNNNMSYQMSLMTLMIMLIMFEYDNMMRGTFMVTLNMM
ncbi:NADH dehydrogenase subunit 2 (mitochondrion) [Pichia kudriavzevii]|uniref:NADH-ubiquinone oxidoreductase chain 2 n=1 Tax=Pichia kudriavzevii TaxID=4909 RepID=A0A2U9RB22_PICKU|nr:NADH dehydrogenase subunit 2 [Pichia kudriavzevii]